MTLIINPTMGLKLRYATQRNAGKVYICNSGSVGTGLETTSTMIFSLEKEGQGVKGKKEERGWKSKVIRNDAIPL